MSIKLIFQLILGVFSFNPKNMRWFNLKRIFFCLLILPFFLLLLIINHFFLLLDYLLFPRFLSQKIEKPVFIIAAPRSATTFLFHILAKQSKKYTSVKLWEIIFAPSISQKIFFISIFKIDLFFGAFLKKGILSFENLLIGKFKKIHKIGLELPEEDEGFLIWNLSTLYLTFFYPDSDFFKEFYQFDNSMNKKKKDKIMKTYKRYIKRHNFVFNKSASRQFLSKNPLMMNKIEGIHSIFPDAQILNINRNLGETLPSTLELNRTIYKAFTSIKPSYEINQTTMEQLIDWYLMANINLEKYFNDQHLKIDFNLLVNQNEDQLKKIIDFLKIEMKDFILPAKKEVKSHKSTNKYEPLTKDQLIPILQKLPFMNEYCS